MQAISLVVGSVGKYKDVRMQRDKKKEDIWDGSTPIVSKERRSGSPYTNTAAKPSIKKASSIPRKTGCRVEKGCLQKQIDCKKDTNNRDGPPATWRRKGR